MLDRLARLPAPQREALRTAFGMSSGSAPDQFLIGLAVLSLLSDVAEDQPLVCLIDDQQWLDSASAQILAFVARRLGAEAVGMVFCVRVPGQELAGLPELVVSGLPEADARALLDSALPGSLDARVRDQIVAETRGNPLALMEMPRGLTSAELAGGYGLPASHGCPRASRESFRCRVAALPDRPGGFCCSQRPTRQVTRRWSGAAAERPGVSPTPRPTPREAGLADIGTRVRFRHPLVRSVTYWAATPEQRQTVHGALAEVTDPSTRSRSAGLAPGRGRSRTGRGHRRRIGASRRSSPARGGLAAAAAFLERAAMMTLDPDRRADRALAAASTKFQAGAFDAATALIATAEAGPLDELQQAHVDLVRAQLAFATSRGGDAPLLLLRAARRLEPIEASLARETYLDAISAAAFAGRLASPGGGVREVAGAAARLRGRHTRRAHPISCWTAWRQTSSTDIRRERPSLRAALANFGSGMSVDEELRWMWLINLAALHLWDDEHWDTLSAPLPTARPTAGAVTELPLALSTRAMMLMFVGDLTAASALMDEQRRSQRRPESTSRPYAAMRLAAMRGQQAETMP